MILDLDILNLAGSRAAHALQRQSLIAQNVANADTPRYRALDLPDFDATFATSGDTALRQTRPGHLPAESLPAHLRPRELSAMGAESPNGNSVSLEDQMVRGVAARQDHDMAMGVYSKALDILRLGLQRGR